MTEKWCEHIKLPNVADALCWNFCPVCGTPRPKQETLEEKVFKALKGEFDRMTYDQKLNVKIDMLTQSAIKVCGENKEML